MEENWKLWEENLTYRATDFNLRGGGKNGLEVVILCFWTSHIKEKWWLKWVLIRLINYMFLYKWKDEHGVRIMDVVMHENT
jgi:hypothetical protein